MDSCFEKFNYYISKYYDELQTQKDIIVILNNYVLLNDAKILYPLLKYTNIISQDFLDAINSLKNINSNDTFDYELYDSLISKINGSSYLENLDVKINYLKEQIDNYLNNSFDNSFLTKFMLDRNFDIKEINYILEKNNAFNTNVSIATYDNPIIKRIDDIILRNYRLILDYTVSDKLNYYLNLYKDLNDENKKINSETDFAIVLFELLKSKKEISLLKDESIRNKYLTKTEKLLENAEEIEELLFNNNSQKEYNLIFLTEKAYDKNYVEIINRLKKGLLDYKKGLKPLKIIDIDKYVVRINRIKDYAVSYIENEDDLLIINAGTINDIVESSIKWINNNENDLESMLNKDIKNER